MLWRPLLFQLVLWEEAPDPISGGAGWIGAGLLGLVLGWLLLKHLPDNARNQNLLVKSFQEELAAERLDKEKDREANQKALERVCQEFKTDIALERQTCERNFQALAQSLDRVAQRVTAPSRRTNHGPSQPPNPDRA